MKAKKVLKSYDFQNIYMILTYRCNWKCPFCLFRYNKEKEASIDFIINRLKYSINDSKQKVYIKITGGEPFLKLDLLEKIFELSNNFPEKIYKIGIGTNGSISLPDFFNDVNVKTNIFLSRHDIYDKLPKPSDLKDVVSNEKIEFRTNCNLIKNKVDNIKKIKQYVQRKHSIGINYICFRELSKVSIDQNLIYPKQIYKYIDYYDKHLVTFSDIKVQIDNDKDFEFTKNTGNYYDNNMWYYYNLGNDKVSIKFRVIDEVKLLEYNRSISPNIVDEYVIHPDGTLTGCWDRELKLLKKGEFNAQ